MNINWCLFFKLHSAERVLEKECGNGTNTAALLFSGLGYTPHSFACPLKIPENKIISQHTIHNCRLLNNEVIQYIINK